MTGDADYLLRLVVRVMPSLERFIIDFPARIPGVARLKSNFSLNPFFRKWPDLTQRSRTRRFPFAREIQGHINRCWSRSVGDKPESLWSGSPSRTWTAQVLQSPARQL